MADNNPVFHRSHRRAGARAARCLYEPGSGCLQPLPLSLTWQRSSGVRGSEEGLANGKVLQDLAHL